MSAAVSPVPRLTFFDNAGAPLNGGLVYTYAAGTLTPKATYSNEALSTPISNPIVLNSAGRPQASAIDTTEVNVYLLAASYKFVVNNSSGTTLYTADNIEAVSPNPVTFVFPLTVTGGVSGGVPYFSSTVALSASALLAANAPVIGGGAGAAPSTITAGIAGQVLTGTGTGITAPAFVGGATLLHAATGTSTAATATTVDSFALPTTLTALDTLVIYFELESLAQATAQALLYSVTDGVSLGAISPSPLTAGNGVFGTITLQMRQGNTAANTFLFNGWSTAAAATVAGGQFNAVTALWASGWTLGLRHGGVTSAGTFKYTWAVYRFAGQ